MSKSPPDKPLKMAASILLAEGLQTRQICLPVEAKEVPCQHTFFPLKPSGPRLSECFRPPVRLVCRGHVMGHASYAWREVCASALRESDPKKLVACLERAITAIERRYAEWEISPGTSNELRAIRNTISGLETVLREKLSAHGEGDIPRSA